MYKILTIHQERFIKRKQGKLQKIVSESYQNLSESEK